MCVLSVALPVLHWYSCNVPSCIVVAGAGTGAGGGEDAGAFPTCESLFLYLPRSDETASFPARVPLRQLPSACVVCGPLLFYLLLLLQSKLLPVVALATL